MIAPLFLCLTLPNLWVSATPSDLVADPSSYTWHSVGVSGKVENIDLGTDPDGKPYEEFKLCDKVCVGVFTWGRPFLQGGQPTTVHGTFYAVIHKTRKTVYYEIEEDTTWHAADSGPSAHRQPGSGLAPR